MKKVRCFFYFGFIFCINRFCKKYAEVGGDFGIIHKERQTLYREGVEDKGAKLDDE